MSRFKLDCSRCSDNQKIDRGCTKDSPVPGRWKIGNVELSRCPISQLNEDSAWFIKAYALLEKGILPKVGGWLDQSNKFNEVMVFITNEHNKIKREESQSSFSNHI